jgi:hypothetical protein
MIENEYFKAHLKLDAIRSLGGGGSNRLKEATTAKLDISSCMKALILAGQ